MIFDCFTFFNEFDVLELRLRTLENVVDRFVLCEAPFTFRGDPKPLHFAQHAERFARWRDRIVYLTYPGPPSDDPWENEWGQRDFLATALAGCAPDDLVLVGDCDEIPDPKLVARRPAGRVLGHRMMLLAGFVNRILGQGFRWMGTRALTYENLTYYGSLSNVRKVHVDGLEAVEGGWHFTALGGAEVMELKMRAYSHAERDIRYLRDRRRLEVEYNAGAGTWVPLDERFPLPLLEDRRWDRYVLKAPPALNMAQAARLEHAHGCFAYVRPEPTAVAVIAADPGAWDEVGRVRFGDAFAGVFSDARALPRLSGETPCVIVDGLQQQPPGTLANLESAGADVVVFAENARSYEVLQRSLSGHGGFPKGRALGRAEYQIEIGAAGYLVAGTDRVFTTRVVIPSENPPGFGIFLGSFVFPNLAREELLDFLTDAFLFTLTPAHRRAAA
jgi:beta-1,4-mannosyl-glycoprotein beta-1,4-N-acetylglucosaminyltransferase